jgi:hypothetical protein
MNNPGNNEVGVMERLMIPNKKFLKFGAGVLILFLVVSLCLAHPIHTGSH